MKLFRPIWMVALFSCFLLVCSCIRQPEQKRIVTVTIQPQKYFAEKIAGDRFDINCIVPNGSNPEAYDPFFFIYDYHIFLDGIIHPVVDVLRVVRLVFPDPGAMRV